MTHTCHAYQCRVAVKPELLMCARHWRMVPWPLKRNVWRHYRAGQCDDKRPSREWHAAADAAILAVADLEGKGDRARQYYTALEAAATHVAEQIVESVERQASRQA
jgi:hypothetical protein